MFRMISSCRGVWYEEYEIEHELPGFEIFGNANVHATVLFADVGCCTPFSGLGEGVVFVFSFVPDFDEGVFCRGVGGYVD